MEKNILVKSVLNKHKKRDSWFLDDYSVNPYEGCSFNCLYCYIRGSKYGENLEEGLAVKSNALEVLDQQLVRRARKGEHGFVGLASATDPYLGLESTHQLSRGFLQLLLKHRFPVHIITKSTLVTRDFDLLRQIDDQAILPAELKHLKRGVLISFSISSLDETITSRLEPGAPTPKMRLATLQHCCEAGFLTGINAMPLLPYLSDSPEEVEKLVKAAKAHGAQYLLAAGLTLFGKDKASDKILYYKFLEKYYPQLLPKYRALYRIFFSPPKTYQENLKNLTDTICARHQVKTSIMANVGA